MPMSQQKLDYFAGAGSPVVQLSWGVELEQRPVVGVERAGAEETVTVVRDDEAVEQPRVFEHEVGRLLRVQPVALRCLGDQAAPALETDQQIVGADLSRLGRDQRACRKTFRKVRPINSTDAQSI